MDISVVVPVYRGSLTLPSLAKQVGEALQRVTEDFELILVNDCSPDESWSVIESLSRKYLFIVGVDLRKNVGQDNAIMAGLNHARGKAVVIMDDDLQHSPADIPALVAKLSEGHDVCYAHFEKKRQALWKNMGSALNGRLASWVIGKPNHIYLSPFKAISGPVVAEMLKYRGPFAYVDGVIWRITSRCTQIPITHHLRAQGEGNYDLVKSIRVWMKLLTGFSVKPLRIITVMGFITSVFSFVTAVAFLVKHLTDAYPVPGWASLIISIFFLSGLQLTCLGMLGEYIGRTYLRLSDQPQYSVRSLVSASDRIKRMRTASLTSTPGLHQEN
jgi:glycosyltransferase involved in cell wall biosynthesis